MAVDDDAEAVGRRVKELREKMGLGVNELDRMVGQNGFTSRLENGEKKRPNLFVMLRVADVLGADVRWLATGEEPHEPKKKEHIPSHLDDDEKTRRTFAFALEVLEADPEAVNRVASELANRGQRRTPEQLLERIKVAQQDVEEERRVGIEEARRQRGERPVGDELDEPLDLDSIRKKPKK